MRGMRCGWEVGTLDKSLAGILEKGILRLGTLSSWKVWQWQPRDEHEVFSDIPSFRCAYVLVSIGGLRRVGDSRESGSMVK